MNEQTHGYLPIADGERIGFSRKALVDMTPAEREYLKDMEGLSVLTHTRPERDAVFKQAYAKLLAS